MEGNSLLPSKYLPTLVTTSVSISKSYEDCLGEDHSDALAVEHVDSRLCINSFGIFENKNGDDMSVSSSSFFGVVIIEGAGLWEAAGIKSGFKGVVIEWAELWEAAEIKSGFNDIVIEWFELGDAGGIKSGFIGVVYEWLGLTILSDCERRQTTWLLCEWTSGWHSTPNLFLH